jgi:DNA-binding NtrC family response regulator
VVDDEERVRTVAEMALARCGYSLLTAANGKEALQIYRLHKDDIDLVVLDLIMPEMGGKQCLSELVKINPHVKVVIASGHLVNGPTKDTLDQGAADYIVKPFEAEQLLHVVRKVLDG